MRVVDRDPSVLRKTLLLISLLSLYRVSLGQVESGAERTRALLSRQPEGRAEFQEFTKRSWQIQDDLPDQVIQAIAQSPDPHLWLGTPTGLLQFDGRSFVQYLGPGAAVLRAHGAFCLLVA